jgi:hypothetical protein
MSTEHHSTSQPGDPEPVNKDVAFETSDIDTRTILSYMFYLALSVIAAFVASVFIFRFTTNLAVDSRSLPPPVRQGVGPTIPPEPRLQGVPGTNDPQQDMRNMLKEDVDANEKLGWIDRSAGIAQIPVEEAMKIIATKGLPVVLPAPVEKKK